MNPAFKLLVMAAISYIAFLCVIRIVMGSQYKAKSFLINIIGMISVYGTYILKLYKGSIKPTFIYYILIIILLLVLPPMVFKMKNDQTLKYLAFGIISLPILHLLFSLFLGWEDLLPFLPLPSISELLK